MRGKKVIQISGFDDILLVEEVVLLKKVVGNYSLYIRNGDSIESFCGEKYYDFDEEKLRKLLFHLHNLKQSISKLRNIAIYEGDKK